MVESALKLMVEECMHRGAHNLLYQAIYLHMFTHVHKNLRFYLQNNFVNVKAAQDMMDQKDQMVKNFSPYTNDCVEALGVLNIDDINAPIARDYVQFNTQPDMNNFYKAGKLFDFQKNPAARL